MVRYLRTSQGLVHWKDYGGSGDLIVLVHGLGGSVANWDALGPRLSRLARTVALDLPGFGLSPPGADWELERQASALSSFIDELGDSAHLIANSMGALISEMVAADHPGAVDSMVLISPATPPTLPSPQIEWRSALRMLLQATPVVGPALTRRLMENSTPREFVRISLELVTLTPGRVPLDVVESLVELAAVRKKLPWAAEAVPKTGNAIARFFLHRSRFVELIREVKSPTLVVHGLDDRIVSPTWVEWMCSLRPDWQLVQMEDTGHTPQLDAPVRLLSVVEPWLAGHLRHAHTS